METSMESGMGFADTTGYRIPLAEATTLAESAAREAISDLIATTRENLDSLYDDESEREAAIARLEELTTDSELLNEMTSSFMAWLAKSHVILPPKNQRGREHKL